MIAVILITIIGWISLSFIGKRLFNFFESILNKIPIIRTIYSAVEQLIETFTNSKSDKKTVVLVEYPRKGVYAVGFATKENTGEIKNKAGKELMNVFVPTTPNPTKRFFTYVSKDEIIYLDLSLRRHLNLLFLREVLILNFLLFNFINYICSIV